MWAVGATFVTLTVWLSRSDSAPSESVAEIETSLESGPSVNLQSKLPESSSLVELPATSVASAPQSGATELIVSSPRSVIV